MFLAIGVFALIGFAQTTGFTYQGSLSSGGVVANGNHDFEFALYDAANGGVQLGNTQAITNVSVANGIFTVSLDFGNQFPGAARFLEIRVRTTGGGGALTTLLPRQPLTSTPYSVRSLNSTTADAVAVGGVPSGSGNYIQNTAQPQASSDFNVSGNGTVGGTLRANIVNSVTQININGSRVLSNAGSFNLFAGVGTGSVNSGSSNSFFGTNAGQANTVGAGNSFFGRNAGVLNTIGGGNAFFGSFSGISNTSGGDNSFFGRNAGQLNMTGGDNAFFGESAGNQNTTGDNNAFFGESAGWANTTGSFNAFFGEVAGQLNTTGIGNSFIGERAGGGE